MLTANSEVLSCVRMETQSARARVKVNGHGQIPESLDARWMFLELFWFLLGRVGFLWDGRSRFLRIPVLGDVCCISVVLYNPDAL